MPTGATRSLTGSFAYVERLEPESALRQGAIRIQARGLSGVHTRQQLRHHPRIGRIGHHTGHEPISLPRHGLDELRRGRAVVSFDSYAQVASG